MNPAERPAPDKTVIRERANRWRVGRKVGRTIYRQAADEPRDIDVLIGVMDRVEDAELVVRAVNTLAAAEARAEAAEREAERAKEQAEHLAEGWQNESRLRQDDLRALGAAERDVERLRTTVDHFGVSTKFANDEILRLDAALETAEREAERLRNGDAYIAERKRRKRVEREAERLREAVARAHRFAGDILLWSNREEPPIPADWAVVGMECEKVKRHLEAALADRGRAE